MKSTNMKERKKNEGKTSNSLNDGATLAVTSNGVTALAAPAADAATESAAVAEVTEEEVEEQRTL